MAAAKAWTLRQIQDELKASKKKAKMSETTLTVDANEYAEWIGVPYNTAWVDLSRNVNQVQEGHPAKFDRIQALELREKRLMNRRKKALAPKDFADEVAKQWKKTGVPQPLQTICVYAGVASGTTAHRTARQAVEDGLLFIVEAHGSEFYLPVGAEVQRVSKTDPDLSALNDAAVAAYHYIGKVYQERLVPPSVPEVGEAIENTYPRYPVEKLANAGLIKLVNSGGRKLYIPVGWKAMVKK